MKDLYKILKVLCVLGMLFALPACKTTEAPKLEVPKQTFECTSSLCRNVSRSSECSAAGGEWSEERNECLSTLEYKKFQCITSGKFWYEADSKCQDEGIETPAESTDEPANPFADENDETEVDIEVEIID